MTISVGVKYASKEPQTKRKMPAIDLFVRLVAGPHVLKNAQIKERPTTRANCFHGKNGATVSPKNKLNCKSIV